MSVNQSVAVPFHYFGNRACLTGLQIAQHPELACFVKRFRHCFQQDTIMDVYWYEPGIDETGDLA